MDDYTVSLIQVEKRYGDATALKNINLGLYRGRAVGVFGGKASGKSTLCRLLCGIERPTSGKILFEGKKINAKAKKRISLLSDDIISGRFSNVKKLMEFYETFYYDFDRKIAFELMKRYGVEQEKKIGNDKGARQLVGLACFAARKADLYVLDDPLTYFDRAEREEFIKEAFRYFENKPLIVICAESLRGIEPLIDDAVFLHNGSVKLCKTTDEIRLRTDKSVEELYKEVFSNAVL